MAISKVSGSEQVYQSGRRVQYSVSFVADDATEANSVSITTTTSGIDLTPSQGQIYTRFAVVRALMVAQADNTAAVDNGWILSFTPAVSAEWMPSLSVSGNGSAYIDYTDSLQGSLRRIQSMAGNQNVQVDFLGGTADYDRLSLMLELILIP